MAPVRNGVLARVATVAAGGTFTFGTVPLTDTWIVKGIFIINVGGGAATIDIGVSDAASTLQLYVVEQSVASLGIVQWQGWLAMGPGDYVYYNTGAQVFHVWVVGADLPGHL